MFLCRFLLFPVLALFVLKSLELLIYLLEPVVDSVCFASLTKLLYETVDGQTIPQRYGSSEASGKGEVT